LALHIYPTDPEIRVALEYEQRLKYLSANNDLQRMKGK